MAGYADLEIGLYQRWIGSYAIELRFDQQGEEPNILSVPDDQRLVQFDFQGLRERELDPVAYGQLLSKSLFARTAVQNWFARMRGIAESLRVPLRLRLFIDRSAAQLHRLHWETLRDPLDDTLLATNTQILFSRYISSLDWRPVRRRSRNDLHALAMIANPQELDQYTQNGQPLAPIDVAGERARVQASLRNTSVTMLDSGGRANLSNLSGHLRDGYDILYLVCHGALVNGEPRLWLENDAGAVEVVAGSDVLARLIGLQHRPLLVVLASCQSAGNTEGVSLTALGARLAEAGIPAVLAMQGNISMETIERFMPIFFQELEQDGQIDRAMAVARSAVQDRPDYWVPVLFMRLRNGRIWYIPGATGEEPQFERWPILVSSIRNGRCTPILGPGLLEFLLGSPRDLAWRWAETYNFPMEPHAREDMARVAQFVGVNQGDPKYPHDELKELVRWEILQRYGKRLAGRLPNVALNRLPLDELIYNVWSQYNEQAPSEPHSVLAELPFTIYITVNPDDLLEKVLAAAGRKPEVDLCRWKDDIEFSSIFARDPGYQPSVERPLVYHLFGLLQVPESLVLTEDDYFEYLIGVTRRRKNIPPPVLMALADTALLFLGFHMDDWSFRVLLHSLINKEGNNRRKRHTHVAVQLDPEEDRTLSPARARKYLESCFDQISPISIFWGNIESFARVLQARWKEKVARDALQIGPGGLP